MFIQSPPFCALGKLTLRWRVSVRVEGRLSALPDLRRLAYPVRDCSLTKLGEGRYLARVPEYHELAEGGKALW